MGARELSWDRPRRPTDRHFKRRVTSKAQDAADRSRARLRLAPSTLSIQTNARAIIANSNRKLRVNPSMAMTFSVLARSICIENTPMLERNNRHATPKPTPPPAEGSARRERLARATAKVAHDGFVNSVVSVHGATIAISARALQTAPLRLA